MSAIAGDDPRDVSCETKLSFPESWQVEGSDGLSAGVLFTSGLIMVSRNSRFLAWPALLLSINSIINQHPLRTKEGGNSPISTTILAVCALVASYVPLLMITPGPKQTQTPLFPSS
ncbi:hypothetical protein EUX98_g5200 [Antrodiella citrinella]|uniref:Uncharacterized protein n=1 Tax=Antrodiella citrinella TaxID=2447956 RepID=A0A4S4MS23_9APHY|nr:hypothetical protein EUX98_g5200 [Antrodiella citrinella]